MLKKSKIAMAVSAATLGALGVANTAQAVSITEDRTGEVNILPYYNVNNNFLTNINITNTTNLYKVVKVRFRESKLSQDVLDFNIYLSPYDQWTGAVRLNASNGLANLVTIDESCTYPRKAAFQGEGQNFVDVYDNVEPADVTEGYVEVYEVGVIADGPGDADDGGMYAMVKPTFTNVTAPGDDRTIVGGIKHDTNGVPPDCDVVIDAWAAANQGFTKGRLVNGVSVDDGVPSPAFPTVPYFFDAANNNARVLGDNDGLVYPVDQTGGISVYSILINAATGAAFVQEATAIRNVATVPQHYRSDDQRNYLLPSLASGDVMDTSWLERVGAPPAGAVPFTWPLSYYDTGALADLAPNTRVPMGANPFPIAAVLTVMGVANDFFVDPAISGSTDWVVTFPMRKHGIYNGATLVNDLDGTGDAAPCQQTTLTFGDTIVDRWPGDGAAATSDNCGYVDNDEDDVVVAARYWDQEEQEVIPDPDEPIVSPPIQDQPEAFLLPREVNVVTFARANESPDSVLGSPAARVFNLQSGWIVGWASIEHDSRYNYGSNGSISRLVDPTTTDIPAASVPEGVFLNTLSGVPTMGFAALEGEMGPASVGETVQYILSLDPGNGG